MENRKAVESINVAQMLFNISGEELAEIMSYDIDPDDVAEIITKIEAATGFKIGRVLQKIEGDLTVQ